MRSPRLLLFALLVLGGAAAAQPSFADWPQYRGPDGDGMVDTPVPPWTGNTPPVSWQRPLGLGFSGISVVDGTLFTLFGAGEDEFLIALDAQQGDEQWRLRLDDLRTDQFGDGPRSTPTVEGDRVFAVSSLGHLWAADRKTGKALWDVDLREDFGAAVPTWGVSATPVVHRDLLLFDVGGTGDHGVMAFDKATGAVRWKTATGVPGYSLPITFSAAGKLQTVFFTGKELVAVSPSKGQPLWRHPWTTAYDVNAAAPIFLPPDRLFVSSGYDTGAAMLRLVRQGGELGVETLWTSRRMKNQFSSSVHRDGVIYGFDNKSLKAIAAETGKEYWRKSGFGHGSLLLAGDRLLVLGDKGKLALVDATAEEYREAAAGKVDSGKHWTVPTLSDGQLFIRNERTLFAFDITAK